MISDRAALVVRGGSGLSFLSEDVPLYNIGSKTTFREIGVGLTADFFISTLVLTDAEYYHTMCSLFTEWLQKQDQAGVEVVIFPLVGEGVYFEKLILMEQRAVKYSINQALKFALENNRFQHIQEVVFALPDINNVNIRSIDYQRAVKMFSGYNNQCVTLTIANVSASIACRYITEGTGKKTGLIYAGHTSPHDDIEQHNNIPQTEKTPEIQAAWHFSPIQKRLTQFLAALPAWDNRFNFSKAGEDVTQSKRELAKKFLNYLYLYSSSMEFSASEAALMESDKTLSAIKQEFEALGGHFPVQGHGYRK